MNFKPLFTDENCKIVNNENHEACNNCGGKCCYNSGCDIIPKDFKSYPNITEDDIMIALASGYVVIDSASEGYFLKMRGIYTRSDIFYDRYVSPCVALTENGCRFKFENRPFGGRILRPQEDTKCYKGAYSFRRAALSWKKYQDLLESIALDSMNNKSEFIDKIVKYKKENFDLSKEIWG